jgi:hypothetical protein
MLPPIALTITGDARWVGGYHHKFLLLLVEHRASMKSFQALRSPAIPLTSFHDLPIFLISSSIVLRHVLFDLPLLLHPWGFQSNAVFSIAPASLRNVCPIQFHFLLFIWIYIGFCLVILHSSSFVILSAYFIFIIRLQDLFISVCNKGGYTHNLNANLNVEIAACNFQHQQTVTTNRW